MTTMRLKDGAIQLTSVTGGTALLTVRGKDHDLDAVELRALADACLAAASTIKVRRKCPYCSRVLTLEAGLLPKHTRSRIGDLRMCPRSGSRPGE